MIGQFSPLLQIAMSTHSKVPVASFPDSERELGNEAKVADSLHLNRGACSRLQGFICAARGHRNLGRGTGGGRQGEGRQ